LSSTLDVSGLASLDGGIDTDGAFTVANTTGNVVTTGTLAVTGASTLTGNTTVGGTFGATGVSTLTGLVNANGGIAVDTNKFTVADGSGNTVIAGTLAVTGAQTLTGITTMSSNATVGGTLQVTGNTTLDGNLTVNGTTTTVNSTTVSIDDPIFNLGGDTAPSSDDNLDRGVLFNYHNGSAAKKGFFGMDDSASEFIYIADATDTSF